MSSSSGGALHLLLLDQLVGLSEEVSRTWGKVATRFHVGAPFRKACPFQTKNGVGVDFSKHGFVSKKNSSRDLMLASSMHIKQIKTQ